MDSGEDKSAVWLGVVVALGALLMGGLSDVKVATFVLKTRFGTGPRQVEVMRA